VYRSFFSAEERLQVLASVCAELQLSLLTLQLSVKAPEDCFLHVALVPHQLSKQYAQDCFLYVALVPHQLSKQYAQILGIGRVLFISTTTPLIACNTTV
jgi:hypothetical protein